MSGWWDKTISVSELSRNWRMTKQVQWKTVLINHLSQQWYHLTGNSKCNIHTGEDYEGLMPAVLALKIFPISGQSINLVWTRIGEYLPAKTRRP